MIVDWGICRIAIPIFAVFAVRPCSSVVIPPVFEELVVDGLVANVGMELCLDFVCLHLCDWSSSFQLQGLHLGFFARRQIQFFADNFRVNVT